MPYRLGPLAAKAVTIETGSDQRHSGAGTRRPINSKTRRNRRAPNTLSLIAFSTGLGLLVCSLADSLSRATLAPSPLLYWAGILILALPIFYRLTSEDASVTERLVLVCLLGLALYGVKVFRDAPIYTFSDEQIHAFNLSQITHHHHLFHENPVLKVTPSYPGLEGAASALATLSGVSGYVAGVVVLAASRLVLIGALFLLFQRLSDSARLAGLGVAIYAGNFNFLYFDAQFSYESLALPLLMMVMLALAEREKGPQQALRTWAVPVVLGMAAIVVTHHLTSYALAGILIALSISYWYVHRRWQPPNPWPFAVLGALLAVAWLVVVASSTVGYLSPVLSDAAHSIANTIGGEKAPRGLFQGGGSTAAPAPFAARAVALLAVAVLAAGLPFGLRLAWRRFRREPFVLLFGLAAVGYFASLALRLAPAAWETGNRAGEFLFVGLAFVLACASIEALRRWSGRTMTRPLMAAAIGLVLVGGAISGWPWDSQLARPLRIDAGEGTIVSPPLAMSEWASSQAPGARFAASTADAGLLLSPGGQTALTGSSPDIEDLLAEERLAGWELPLLRRHHVHYLIADQREEAADSLRGFYFSQDNIEKHLFPKSVVSKFNRLPGVDRVYTNGVITAFDLEGPK